jgi:putative DNA primase/helicase
MVRLKGRRFATMQEPDEQVPLNTGLMKELASSEKISVRDLYQGSKQMVDFEVQAKLHLSCNEKPEIKTTDGGTWRRLVVINFPMKFVAEPRAHNELPIDDTIVYKVVSTEWATCFMNYLIHLLKEGKGWRKLTPPDEVMEYTNEYKEESDVVARFMRDMLVPTEKRADEPEPEKISKAQLISTFQQWKRDNDVNRGSSDELAKRVEAAYGKYFKPGWSSFRFGTA